MTTEVQVKDVLPVRSRISWGAILAGTMTAIAVYFLLVVLGIAIGATISYRTGETDFSMGAAIWAIITLMLALFAGGCVASQCTVGESKSESVIYGTVLWGTMFTMLVWLTATGFKVGFGDVLATASSGRLSQISAQSDYEQYLRAQGISEEGLRQHRRDYPNDFASGDNQSTVATFAQDPRTVSAAWWTFGGILLSMLAAISGALTGAGPTFTLAHFGFRSLVIGHHNRPGQARTAV